MGEIIITKKRAKKPDKKDPAESSSKRRTTACLELTLNYRYRRALSESNLLDACEKFDFQEGHCYNFITAGDVDSLTYLKAILRQQPLDHLLLSTWCMSAQDIFQIGEWLDSGKIKHLDCYLGEIFPTTYRVEFQMIVDMYNDGRCGDGRYAVFRNHSKIFAGVGDKFAFGVQSSANINTNPRTEQGSITISRELYEFYKNYFDDIKSFEYGTT